MFFFITTPSVQPSKPIYDLVIDEYTHSFWSLHLGVVVRRQKRWRLVEDGVESSEVLFVRTCLSESESNR